MPVPCQDERSEDAAQRASLPLSGQRPRQFAAVRNDLLRRLVQRRHKVGDGFNEGANPLTTMKQAKETTTPLTLLRIPRQCRAGRGLQSVEGEAAVEVIERASDFLLLAQDHFLEIMKCDM